VSAAALWAAHGPIVPIALPLVAGSLLLLLEASRSARASALVPWVSLLATAALLLASVQLLVQADSGVVQAYLLGNWQAPFGIALALDRLAALMLVLMAVVALGSLVYALGGDSRRGVHFHALFQFQLMGLAGAFLTTDLFNLFVFFEVLLAASYGLLLHGDADGRRARLRSALHYVVFNLVGSALFLIAVSLLYGLAGTLNMADLALKLPQLGPENARLAQAAALMLLVVFAVKAALLPLYFWLPETYASATAPVAALFAIMTKVGVYAILRMSTLVFGAGAGATAGSVAPMLPLALATLTLAAIGALAARRLNVLVAYLVIGSAGTLLLAVALAEPASVAAALFYLVNSTLVAALWFLLCDRITQARGGSDRLQPAALGPGWAGLGVLFLVAAVAVAGVPPLAGFMGKTLLLQAVGALALAPALVMTVVALVLLSSLLMMVALARAGSLIFWKPGPAAAPAAAVAVVAPRPAQTAHGLALAGLAAAVVASAVAAGPISAYTEAAAAQLFERQTYLRAVLGAQPAPPAYDVRKEMRERGDAK